MAKRQPQPQASFLGATSLLLRLHLSIISHPVSTPLLLSKISFRSTTQCTYHNLTSSQRRTWQTSRRQASPMYRIPRPQIRRCRCLTMDCPPVLRTFRLLLRRSHIYRQQPSSKKINRTQCTTGKNVTANRHLAPTLVIRSSSTPNQCHSPLASHGVLATNRFREWPTAHILFKVRHCNMAAHRQELSAVFSLKEAISPFPLKLHTMVTGSSHQSIPETISPILAPKIPASTFD